MTRLPPGTAPLPIVASLCLAGWAVLALALASGHPAGLDSDLYLLLRDPGNVARPVGPAWLVEAVRDLTALGSTLVLATVTVLGTVFLLLARRPLPAAFLLAASLGAQALVSLSKLAFDRPRPDLAPHAAQVFTASFPSGHAAVSAATYLALGLLVARLGRKPRLGQSAIACAVALALMIGLSRIHLGVHWPSDVAAGWCLGLAWILACLAVYDLLARRGISAIRSTPPPGP